MVLSQHHLEFQRQKSRRRARLLPKRYRWPYWYDDETYNLRFDPRFYPNSDSGNFTRQRWDGLAVKLIRFDNRDEVEIFNELHIYLDLAFSIVGKNDVWHDFNIDWSARRDVDYFGCWTKAPSLNDTHVYLKEHYGKRYLTNIYYGKYELF